MTGTPTSVRAATLAGAAVVAWPAYLLDLGSPLRPPLLLGFLLVVPGAALVLLHPIGDPLENAVTSVAVSAVLVLGISALLFYTSTWTAGRVVGGAALVTLAACGLAAVRELGLGRRWR